MVRGSDVLLAASTAVNVPFRISKKAQPPSTVLPSTFKGRGRLTLQGPTGPRIWKEAASLSVMVIVTFVPISGGADAVITMGRSCVAAVFSVKLIANSALLCVAGTVTFSGTTAETGSLEVSDTTRSRSTYPSSFTYAVKFAPSEALGGTSIRTREDSSSI